MPFKEVLIRGKIVIDNTKCVHVFGMHNFIWRGVGCNLKN